MQWLIWLRLTEFINEYMIVNTDELNILETKTVFLNNWHKQPGHIIKLIMLLTKQYIYYCKCKRIVLSFKVLLTRIDQIHKFELAFAKQVKRFIYHQRKWAPYTLEVVDDSANKYNNDIEEYANQYLQAI